MSNFTEDEFKCKCGICELGFNDMKEPFLLKLYRARHISGVQYVLNSAMRCEEHNKAIGGNRNSSHLEGLAVDIKTENSVVRYRVFYGLILAGFHRMEIGINYIHADDHYGKPQGVIWLHPKLKENENEKRMVSTKNNLDRN